MALPGNSNVEFELYYLVAKFLENGPCQEIAEALKKQLTKNKLVIPRKDWKGDEHNRTFEEYDNLNNHVQNDHLLSLTEELLKTGETPNISKRLHSLLSRGNFSLLKQEKEKKDDGIFETTSKKACCLHSVPLLPSTKKKHSSICTSIYARSFSGANYKTYLSRTANIYSKLSMHKRILGHLASVYCILFDHTGSIIVTGADDNLLKVWSAVDGRLIATFRGHSGQITDISIDKSNQYIASGSLDKTIRVWNLRNTYPGAVLQGHSGMITSLQFCPCADPKVRYLISTGGDSNVCFWPWYPETGEFSLSPIKFNEKTRAGVQMLCSSFSPGGSFLVAGSTDNYIRVYQLYPNEPEKIAELPNHSDHVDSILYNNFGSRFLSGSRDGMAMVWSFEKGEWQSKCLDSSNPLKQDTFETVIADPKNKLKVTMICWSTNDKYVLTAATDFLIRLWDSYSVKLVNVLKGHTDEVYILESHPVEQNLLLSAGHDGNLILWDIESGNQIKRFFNLLEGQGHGAIFDCKFSPTGLQFSATDSHGHLLIFGLGSDNSFQMVPTEQFFHSDYRPIIRDASNYVLDEQTETAPHLLPPPYLVDIDGNPYPLNYQMLIPGRTVSNLPQRRVQQANQNLPPLLAQIAAEEEANRGLRTPSVIQQNAENALFSPGGVGLRESGDIEGVRQENNRYVSGDITDADAESWRNRTIIPKNVLYNQREKDQKLLQQSIDEISNYKLEQRKANQKLSQSVDDKTFTGRAAARGRGGRGRARGRGTGRVSSSQVVHVRPSALRHLPYLQPVNISDSEPDDWQGESSDTTTDDDSDYVEETRSQPAASSSSRRSTRAQRRKNRAQRMAALVEGERSDGSEVDVVGSESENDNAAEDEENSLNGNEEESNQSSADEERKEESKKTRAARARRKTQFCETDEENENEDNENEDNTDEKENSIGRGKRKKRRRVQNESLSPLVKNPPKKQQKKTQPKRKEKTEIKTKKPLPSIDDIDAYLSCYAPPEWLQIVDCKKFPYFPQIGDEVYYLRQGHNLYVQEVIKQNEYDIQESRQAFRRYDLAPAELCKLIGIQYDVGPPKMCSLKLELISKKKSTGNRRTVTVRFHDMPNVVDFLVLKHIFDESLAQGWAEGDRFRCIIDDTWYFGDILEVSPLDEEFLTSSFLSLFVRWDSGDEERVSPWDLERVPDDIEEVDTPVTAVDKKLFQYVPSDADWQYEDLEQLRTRALEGLKAFSNLEIAEPFAYPVDGHTYPTYWSIIAFPTDFHTIIDRINHRFYRRIEALLWEVRQLKSNADKFNEPGSEIALNAAIVVKVLSAFLKDPKCTDIISLYNETMNTAGAMKPTESDGEGISEDEQEEEEDGNEEDMNVEAENEEDGSPGPAASTSQGSSRTSTGGWVAEARSLLDFISLKDDAKPFLQPVNVEEFSDYTGVVSEPIDISTIRLRLDQRQYGDAEAYIKDFQLMFRNSKAYNTDRRSPIYKMTLRLSALFDSRCEAVRQTYLLANNRRAEHMTRTRTRRILNDDTTNNPGPSSSSRTTRTTARINGDVPSSSRQYNAGASASSSASPRKPIISKISLSQYVRKSSPSSGPSASSSKRTRSRTVVKTEDGSGRSSNSSSSSSEEGEEEVEIKEEDEEDRNIENGHDSSPDISRTSPRKSSRRSDRKPIKRVRYGFESEDDEQQGNVDPQQPTLKKMRKHLNYSMDKKHEEMRRVSNGSGSGSAGKSRVKQQNGKRGKKPSQNGGVGNAGTGVSQRSSGRSRTSVNYCENFDDNFEEFEEVVEEIGEGQEEEITDQEDEGNNETTTANGIPSTTEEEIEVTDTDNNNSSESESDNDAMAATVAVSSGVSSRGRVRKAATRFLD